MKPTRSAFVPPLVVLALVVAGAGAQEPAATPPFGERLEVEVVNVDVVVMDADGERVVDLAKGDFALEVDGRSVPIDYFSPPAIVGGGRAGGGSSPAGGDAGAGIDLAAANLFVFVDQSALEWRTSGRIVDELREFVLPRTGGTERIMIAAFANNLRILSPPTTERARIEQAFAELETMRGRGSLAAAERWRLEREVRENGRARAQPSIDNPDTPEDEQAERERVQEIGDTEMLRAEVEAYGEDEIERQSRSVAALRSWIGGLAAVEGRKSVLFASAGFSSQPAQFLVEFLNRKRAVAPTDRTQSSDLATRGVTLLTDFEAMVEAAENARVAFYTVTPREAPSLTGSAEFGSAGVAATAPPPRDPSIAEAASSLRRLATATGGDSLVLDDELSDRLAGVTDDAAASYSLGFSTGESAGGGNHSIRVVVKRPELTVRHRESFRRTTLAERAESALVAAATLETVANPLGLRLEIGEAKALDKKGKEALVPVLVRIPLALVGLSPEGGRRTARLVARVAVENEEHHLKFGAPQPIAIDVPETEVSRALDGFWAYRAEVMVSRGRQRVAVAVTDETAGTVSTQFAWVERPAP